MNECGEKKTGKLIILTGPTGVGKTKISIGLAKALDGEIISADSVQVYRGLNVGSAKIRPNQMCGIPHHLIDVLDPKEPFDVTIFQELALGAMEEIWQRGRLPIVVGGTGFYIQALRKGVDFTEEPEHKEIRERLEKEAAAAGAEAFHERLKEIDPASYERIPAGNVKRVVRALEFYELHHSPISAHNDREKEKKSRFADLCFVLSNERGVLYDAINKRVDQMAKEGLAEEVKALYESGLDEKYNSMQGIGYKEMLEYVKGRCTLEEALEKVKLNTRHFAKRQFTYFKGMDDVIWFDKSEYDNPDEEIAKEMIRLAKEKFSS